MNSVTILEMLNTRCHENTRRLKISLNRYKNIGLIFYQEDISELSFVQPFELYFYVTKGNITYQNAFPIPLNSYKNLMEENSIQELLPYYQAYYRTSHFPDPEFFEALSFYEAKKFVWAYKKGTVNEA